MSLELAIQNAITESASCTRRGDTFNESEEIVNYIKNSSKIIVPNCNDQKVLAINEVLAEYGLPCANHLDIQTNCCDVSRMPALAKAVMALDVTNADLIIARGRLGVPGSGSMLVIIDYKGRILSAAISPPHHIHGKTVFEAVKEETASALKRIGLNRKVSGDNNDGN